MNKKSYIHPLIKKPLMLFMAVIIVAITLVAASDRYIKHAYEGRQSENRAMRLWKNKIDGSRESNRIIDQYETDYLALVKNNIIGEENRLNWLETIQETANAKGLLSVKYNVSSQRLVEDKTGQHSMQGLKIYRSQMTLDMEMAHEGDLFSMLNTLHKKAQGLFTVDKCVIESTGKRIHAYCDLSWYSFKLAEKRSQQ
ncbi:MAG: hypothetical protein RQ936_05880 [Gammaproteobacteria bacterium]|nr:hypothetical protein [Gammaproteobacteria bacterium]